MSEAYGEEYSEATCITVGELRAAGAVGIPDDVPDCAWVPRTAVAFRARPGGGTLNMAVDVVLHAPFRWIDVQFRMVEVER